MAVFVLPFLVFLVLVFFDLSDIVFLIFAIDSGLTNRLWNAVRSQSWALLDIFTSCSDICRSTICFGCVIRFLICIREITFCHLGFFVSLNTSLLKKRNEKESVINRFSLNGINLLGDYITSTTNRARLFFKNYYFFRG